MSLRNAFILETAMAVRQIADFFAKPDLFVRFLAFPIALNGTQNAKRQHTPGAPTAHDVGRHSHTMSLPFSACNFAIFLGICLSNVKSAIRPYYLVRDLFRIRDRLLDAPTVAGLQKSEIFAFPPKILPGPKNSTLFLRFLAVSSTN